MSLGTRYTSGRSAIDNARRKYGPSSFTYEILERVECDTLESRSALLNEREVYWISYYDTYKHGYNSTTGGLGLPLLVCGPPSARVQLYIPQIKFGGYGFV